MIPLSHPLVQDYLRVARARPVDSVDVRIMLGDRLSDLGGLPYIGEPGGLDLATCCWWYARCEDADEPALREALATVDELLGGGKRALRVRLMQVIQARVLPNALGVVFEDVERMVNEAALRNLRRRVLELYPEVHVLDRKLSFDASWFRSQDEVRYMMREAEARMRAEGWADWVEIHCRHDEENRRVIYSQTLYAPNLISPEPMEQAYPGYALNITDFSALAAGQTVWLLPGNTRR